MHYHWEQTAAKKMEHGKFEQRTSSKKAVTLWQWLVSLNNSRAVYIASYESCELKWFSRCCNKVEERHIQEQQPNQIHCYIQNMGFVNRMDHSMTNYRLVSRWRNSGDPHLFEWWMFIFKVGGYCIVLTMMKAMNLSFF